MYCDPECKPWTSSKWTQPGYSDRAELIEQTKAMEANKPLEEKRIENNSVGSTTDGGFTDVDNAKSMA